MDRDAQPPAKPSSLRRRRFLKLAFATTVLAAHRVFAGDAERSLSFFHTHTGESLEVVYWAGGRHVPEGLARIDRLLRDHRTGEVHPIDPRLLDLLYDLQTRVGSNEAFHVISGYRSRATNGMLRTRSNAVAQYSLHMDGLAIDVRLPGTDLRVLRDAAIALHRGGVGYYPESDFVHLDLGRVRQW
jgi:uncharacterized protein YcbK (DUF882 family)